MKKIKAALFASLLAACIVFAAGCGSSDSESSKADSQTAQTEVIGSDAAPTSQQSKQSATEKSETEVEMSKEVAEAALKYCGANAENGDTVELQKTDATNDGKVFHFLYVKKGETVIPLVVSADAKTIYEPSDYYARYGNDSAEETTADYGNDDFPDEYYGYDRDDYDENYDDEYYY